MKKGLNEIKGKVGKTLNNKRLKSVGMILLIAFVMFSVTYLLQSLGSSLNLSGDSSQITDWAFVSGVKDEQISADNIIFKQAKKNAPVSVDSSKPYTHLYYSFDASDIQRNLVIKTNHAPMKAEINSNVIYNNGYKTSKIVGNSFNEIVIPASATAQTVHIYMYSPMDFEFSATLSENRYLLNIPVLLGLLIIGVGIVFLLSAIGMGSEEIIKAAMISVGMMFFGVYVTVYALESTSMILASSMWYNVSVALSIIAAAFCYFNIIFLANIRSNASKALLAALPVIAAAEIFVPFGVFFKVLMFICALVQCALAALIFIEIESAGPFRIKGEKIIKVAVAYLAIINVFNTLSTVFPFSSISPLLLIIGITVMYIIIYTYFVRKVTVSKIIDEQREKENDDFSKFCSDMSDLVAKLYNTHTSDEFITVFCREIIPIIKNSKEIAVLDDGICYSSVLEKEGEYTLLESVNTDEQPDFSQIDEEIGKGNCIIGNSYIGVKFSSGTNECAAAYIGNIAIPFESGFKNYISALCSASQVLFLNNNLESELVSVEERLFINLSKIVETRSDETSHHLSNVSLMTEIICKQLGYSDTESKLIATASMTHDIGKVAIPDAVLKKRGIYTPEERKIMRKHTGYGYNILSVSNGRFFEIAAIIAKQHHENYDGSGYYGIKGEEINRYARIVKVVDTFDALVSKRCYKKPWNVKDAVEYINENSGTEFDPEIVNAFNACIDEMISVRE